MRHYLVLILSVFLFTDCIAQKGKGLAIVNVNIINVAQPNDLSTAQTILINGDKISRIGNSKQVKVPPGFTVIDGKDKFLIPGLWDMHVHLTSYGPEALSMLIRNGVTTVRDMGGDSVQIDQWRADIKSGKITGPKIFRTNPPVDEHKKQNKQNKPSVKLLAESNFTTKAAGIVPGKSLHDELQSFVKSGLTPIEALKTATINAAVMMGEQKNMGSIGEGKIANVVLLDADPLKDIANTKKISKVILNGRLINN